MNRMIHFTRQAGLVLAAMMLATACVSGVNESLEVEPGAERSGDMSTVNGSVTVGDGARVEGDASTVNGGIRIGADSRIASVETVNGKIQVGDGAEAESLTTVNGRIRVGSGAEISGEVTAVNGAITLGMDTRVGGTVSNVNGTITVEGAHLESDLATSNGDILLSEGATVAGNVHVRDRNDRNRDRPVRVVIGRDVVVEGTVRIDRPASVYVHESAEIGGIEGAEAETYSGDEAPE